MTTTTASAASAPARTNTRSTGHPLAWWAWGGGAAVALSRITNPVLIALILLAVVLVALARRPGGPWARALEAALVLGAVVIAVRSLFYVLLGLPDSSPVVLSLPGLDLPGWMGNITLLGPVHRDGLIGAVIAGLTLAALIVTAGAVNAVANPRRALRSLPSSLHHLGTAAVVAVSAVPQLLTSIVRIRRAQRLRGGNPGGLRTVRTTLIPVLAGALDQALDLAASMDSRGYARAPSRGGSLLVGGSLIVALLAAAGGTYGLLSATRSSLLPAILLLAGLAIAVGASVLASRAVRRTRYRPERWRWQESLTTACGAAAATTAWLGGRLAPELDPWNVGDGWPGLGWAGLLIVVTVAVPALLPDREAP